MSTKLSHLGDALMCPVCYFEFDGRILQCSQGHAVCEKCSLKLTECPHCRSGYCGTRNYVLEEVIAKLRGLSCDASKKSGSDVQTDATSTNAPKRTTTKEAPDDADRPISIEPNVGGARLESLEDILNSYLELDSVLVYPKPVQAKGSFICRMNKCGESLPICRLLNHIRYHHAANFIESEYVAPNRFAHQLSGLPSKSYRLAIKIKSLGLFFLILNVKKETRITNYRAWVQCVSPNNDARNFRFSLELLVGRVQVVYTDMVYGAQSTAAYIEEKEQCLHSSIVDANPTLDLKVEIFRNNGPKNMRRTADVSIDILPEQSPAVAGNSGSASNATTVDAATANVGSRRRQNRNRNRRQN